MRSLLGHDMRAGLSKRLGGTIGLGRGRIDMRRFGGLFTWVVKRIELS